MGSISIFVGGKPSKTLSGHTRLLKALALSADDTRLASAGADHVVRIWDGKSGKQLHTLAGHEDAVLACAFSPDATLLATGGMDRALYMWALATGEPSRLAGPRACVEAVAFTPDGTRVVSADATGIVRVHVIATKKVVAQHKLPTRATSFQHRLVMVADGSWYVGRSSGKIVRLAH